MNYRQTFFNIDQQFIQKLVLALIALWAAYIQRRCATGIPSSNPYSKGELFLILPPLSPSSFPVSSDLSYHNKRRKWPTITQKKNGNFTISLIITQLWLVSRWILQLINLFLFPSLAHIWIHCNEWVPSEWESKQLIWWTGVVYITCGLL